MSTHLEEDYNATLALVKSLRQAVRDNLIVDDALNPAARLLNSEQLHYRGLARIRGPLIVEKDIGREFRDASKLGKELTEAVTVDPVSPLTTLLRDTQTHIRGCAQILANARANVPPEKDEEGYGQLFHEPGDARIKDPRIVTPV